MAENSIKTASSGASSPRTPTGASRRNMFDDCFCFGTTCRHNLTSRFRRRLRGDVEEEFHYAGSYCLSSYYSVFVVRLAIMVYIWKTLIYLYA